MLKFVVFMQLVWPLLSLNLSVVNGKITQPVQFPSTVAGWKSLRGECERPPAVIPPKQDISTMTLWELLKKTESEMEIHSGDAILQVGNTGSGKSTILLTVAGNLSELHVYETTGDELIIVDKNQTIGITTASRTLIPDLRHDPVHGLFYYDCPGFSDNRGTNADITANFLVKKVMENISSVRLVFSVISSAVKVGNDRNNFDYLALSAVNFIRNLDKLNNGIGLIVTKTENYNTNTGRFREDKVILNGIVEFLKQYKEDQEKQLIAGSTHAEVIKRKIKFVNILLQKDRIYFFRQPEKCGPFVESKFTEPSKQGMIKLMKTHLKPVTILPTDFGFAVTDSTLVQIYSLYEQLNKNITQDMTKLVARLRKAHFETTLTFREYSLTKEWIRGDLQNFTETNNNLKESKIPKEFGTKVAKTIVARGYNQRWALDFQTDMERIDSYMNFFDVVAREGQIYPRNSNSWRKPLDDWVTQLGKRNDWFVFLGDLRKVLESYKFQNNAKPAGRPRTIRELQTLLKDQGDIIKQATIDIYENKKDIIDQDIDMMWDLVEEAIEKTVLECSSYSLIVTGTFVKVNDFIRSDGTYLKKCSGSNRVVAKVFATRKLFFDNDIHPKDIPLIVPELALVAPHWELVIGPGKQSYNVNLAGARGADVSGWVTSNWIRNPGQPNAVGPSIPQWVQAKCNNKGPPAQEGSDGRNGKPGGTGSPGGNFVGILDTLVNSDRLTVSVSGGDGTNGVDGESGSNGHKGRTYEYNDWETCNNCAPCAPYDCANIGRCTCNSPCRWTGHFDNCHRKSSLVVDCEAGGCLGGRGGHGGDGGAFGFGGNVGKADLVALSNGVNIGIQKNDGRDGKDGDGKSGGLGGLRGDGYVAGIHQSIGCLCTWDDVKRFESTQRSPSGNKGTTGAESTGRQPARKPKFILNRHEIVLAYKRFAIPKQSEFFPNDFIQRLNDAPAMIKEQTPIQFAQELLILEELNLGMKNNKMSRDSVAFRLLPHYYSILNRVDTYTQVTDTLGDPDRKLLSLLYSTVHNQVRTLKQVAGTSVIVDVAGYLDSVESRLKIYNDLNTALMVDEERIRYRDTFLVKIEQAMVFLVDTVNPAVEETYDEIDGITKQLEVAVEAWIKGAEEQEQAYNEALDQAKKRKVMNDFFSVLKVGAAALSILGGPIGGAVGGMIGTGVAIGEGIGMGEGTSIRPPTPLPDSIKKYAGLMEAKAKATSAERQAELDTLIAESRSAVRDNRETLTVLQGSIDQLEKDKTELVKKGQEGTLKQFNDLEKSVRVSEKALIELLEKRIDQLEKAMKGDEGTPEEQEVAKKHGEKAIKHITHVNKCIKVVGELGLDIYNTHKNDRNEIARLSGMIDEVAEQIGDLEKYKEAVNGILVPFTDSVINDLDAYATELTEKSAVFIRVQRWKVQTTLRNYNYFLLDFTQAFPDIAKQYGFQVENLQEAMTLMIDLYDLIEQYNEQMQFADYIANINSPRGRNAVLGPEAGPVFYRIDLAMHASLILIEWDRVIETFEQWVFPFANVFQSNLQTSQIPNYLAPEIKNVNDVYKSLVPNISKRVSDLKIALQSYKSAVFESIDTELIKTEFNSNRISTVPFFRWESERNKREFLLGERVTVVALPETTYGLGMSAVKFTVTEIEPKSSDEQTQAKLLEQLKSLRIRLTHSGVSRYLYDDSETNMVGTNLTIQYNFERDAQGNRLGRNSVYDKLLTGDMILSPYTVWTAQLLKVHPELEFDFEEFATLAPSIELELIGRGSFVRQKGKQASVQIQPTQIPLFNLRGIEPKNHQAAEHLLKMLENLY